jgi:CheY-like chemotaxis protein
MGRTDLVTDGLRGVHVLLVDDDRDSLEILGTITRYFGALTTEVSDADAAVRTLRRIVPDVVIVDLLMPGRDGLSLVREIRATPKTAAVRTVAVTGHTDLHARSTALAAGFDAYLRKPVDPVLLCRTVAELAQPRADGGAAPGPG